MGTLRSFSYDDPNYTVVRQFCTAIDDISASTAQFGKFRSRVAIVVNAATIVAHSQASVAKVVYTILRNSSINTTITIVSATSAGAYTIAPLAMTLLSAGDLVSVLSDSGGGEYQVLYEYQILPSESPYTRA